VGDAEALISARTKRLTDRNVTEADVAVVRTPAVILDGVEHMTAFARTNLVLARGLDFLSTAVVVLLQSTETHLRPVHRWVASGR